MVEPVCALDSSPFPRCAVGGKFRAGLPLVGRIADRRLGRAWLWAEHPCDHFCRLWNSCSRSRDILAFAGHHSERVALVRISGAVGWTARLLPEIRDGHWRSAHLSLLSIALAVATHWGWTSVDR